ncbi:butyrophilin subfamily 2 member A2-like [Siniperca chuatsi]|uniref:butyrophilin subfamily 2 member A2-like n=1 Tax=Siniperca chuatsi TaxID=119488 RepID=UPI001CE06CB6|nr:butyrophilin subfamily 2 member A2-like [Siniperca chuatsi]
MLHPNHESNHGESFKTFRGLLFLVLLMQPFGGAVSTPIIGVTLNNNGGVVLQCESAGWYPEPEVLWLDGEGKLISAGPTETIRGPDGLYTVSSRVTVVKRHGNSFTCRVQQQNINQARETHIHVPAAVFMVQSSLDWIWISGIPLAAMVFILLLFCCPTVTERIKRKQEATTEYFKNLVRKDENKIKADSPESSTLTGQMEQLGKEERLQTNMKRERQNKQISYERQKRKMKKM